MWHEDDVGRLVKSIYAAPLAKDGWLLTLNDLVQELGARWAQLHVSDFWSKNVPLSDLNPRDPDVLSGYVDHFAHKDPRLPFAFRADGRARPRAEMVPDESFVVSEIYNELLATCEAEQSMVLSLRGVVPGANFLTFMRAEQGGPFTAADCRLVSFLEPHIQQAHIIQKQMSALDRVVRVQDEALDALGAGVILLELNGCAVHINRAAEAILAQMDGLYLDAEGRCRAMEPNANNELTRLVGEASNTSLGEGLHPGGSLGLTRPSGKRPFRVTVAPLDYERIDLGTAPVVVALTVTDPERQISTAPDALATHYGLTPAEARLATNFLETASLKESAETLRITQGTARQYLKRIFQKTETRSQVELMKFLSSIV